MVSPRAGDRERFLALWGRFLATPYSTILPTQRSLGWFAHLLERWGHHGDGTGVALWVPEVGVIMAGEPGPLPFDTSMGRYALGLGTWVAWEHRRQGVATALRTECWRRLSNLGFHYVVGSWRPDNPEGEGSARASGMVPFETTGRRQLP